MFGRQRRAHSYLLRFWTEPGPAWRFSLEDPHTGQRHGFAGLEALIAYLRDEMVRTDVEGPRSAESGDGPDGGTEAR